MILGMTKISRAILETAFFYSHFSGKPNLFQICPLSEGIFFFSGSSSQWNQNIEILC
jgi:hypothetical protein